MHFGELAHCGLSTCSTGSFRDGGCLADGECLADGMCLAELLSMISQYQCGIYAAICVWFVINWGSGVVVSSAIHHRQVRGSISMTMCGNVFWLSLLEAPFCILHAQSTDCTRPHMRVESGIFSSSGLMSQWIER
jgi:hypothetical protein